MKVMLLGINARFTHVNPVLYYLRNLLDEKKYQREILETTINDHVWDIMADIMIHCPDVLCISCYIWNQSHVQSILRDIKKFCKDLIIVCGGPDVSYNSQEWLDKFPSIDHIIQGYGEGDFLLLQHHGFKYPTKIINDNKLPLAKIPLPYLPADKERLRNRYLYYEASRGCHSKCSYCISSISEQPLEYKEVETVKQEILTMLELEPIVIKFVDRSFNFDHDFCMGIWEFILQLDTSTKFHFEIHPLYFSEKQREILEKMPENRVQLEIGIQTTHNKTLELIDREGTWKEVRENIRDIFFIKNRHFDMIAGLPGEKLKDIKQTFERLIRLHPSYLQIGFLKVLPGTKIAKEADKWGYQYQSEAPYRVISSNSISVEELYQFELVELAVHSIYNSRVMKNFTMQINNLLDEIFGYYLTLGIFLYKNLVNKSVSDKKRIFWTTKDHFDHFYKYDDFDYYLDNLRYDWFVSQDTHYYPEFLEAKHCDTFKKDFYLKFKEFLQKEYPTDPNSKDKGKITNAIFYTIKDYQYSKGLLMASDGIAKVGNMFYYIYLDDNENITKLRHWHA